MVRRMQRAFFHEQTPEDIMSAVEKFESIQDDLSPENCRSNALRFSAHRFREEFSAYLKDKWINFQELKRSHTDIVKGMLALLTSL